MDAFSRVVETLGGLSPGEVQTSFFPEAGPALEFVREKKPPLGIVSLPFYLCHRDNLHLIPLLQVVRKKRRTQTFHILARKGRYPDLEAMRGKPLASNHLFDPRFLSHVVLEGKFEDLLAPGQTRRPFRAIRRVARGEEEAVLVDNEQIETLQTSKRTRAIWEGLTELHRSRKLPTEPLVTIGPGKDDPRIDKIRKALEKLATTEEGGAVCAQLRLDRFAAPDEAAFGEAERLYAGEEE